MDTIKIGEEYYYTGIGVNSWKNKKVKTLCKLKENIDNNNFIITYLCEDREGDIKKVIESDLSPIYYYK